MMSQTMKKLVAHFALLTPVQSFLHTMLKNTWSLSGAIPSFKDRAFDVKYIKGYRGCVAKKKIKKGDTLLSIPWDSVIAVKTDTTTDSDELLAFKLYEKVFQEPEKDTLWKDYSANLLPASEELNACLFWTDDEIKELQLEKEQLDAVAKACNRLQQQQVRISRRIKTENGISEDDEEYDEIDKKIMDKVSWCQRIVHSRSFALGDEEQWRCLVPLADMFNHLPEAPWTQTKIEKEEGRLSNPWRLIPNEKVELRSVHAVSKVGAEILIPYGCETNLELLCSYGFSLRDANEAQYIPLYNDIRHLHSFFKLRLTPAIFQKKLAKLKSLDASEAPLAIRPGSIDRSGHLLGCAMYLLSHEGVFDTGDVLFMQVKDDQVGHNILSPKVPSQSRKKASLKKHSPEAYDVLFKEAKKLISKRCGYILNNMPTTLDDDRVLYSILMRKQKATNQKLLTKASGGVSLKKTQKSSFLLDDDEEEAMWSESEIEEEEENYDKFTDTDVKNERLKLALEYRISIKELLLSGSCWH